MKKSIATFLLVSLSAFLLNAPESFDFLMQSASNSSEAQSHVFKESIQIVFPTVQGRIISPLLGASLLVPKEDRIECEEQAIKNYFSLEHLRTNSPLQAYKYALQLYTSDS